MKEEFFVVIGKRDSEGKPLNFVEVGYSETGYAIIDYQREKVYLNALPDETIQFKVDKELEFWKPQNIIAVVKEAVSRAR